MKLLLSFFNWILKKNFKKTEAKMSKDNIYNELNVNNVNGNINYSPTVEKHYHKTKVEKIYPDGSIGADPYAHGYVKYLAQKASEAQNKSGIKATPQKYYTQFEREHGLTPLYSSVEKLDIVISFLQNIIDKTRFVRGVGHNFYHSFEEHKAIINNPKGKKGVKNGY